MIKRGEIWWAALGDPKGSEPGYKRPVLILQANEFNVSRISTTIVVALTTNTALALAPGNILIRPRESGLKKASVINVSQMITINKDRLSERVRMVSGGVMSQVESGIKLVLGFQYGSEQNKD